MNMAVNIPDNIRYPPMSIFESFSSLPRSDFSAFAHVCSSMK